MKRKVTFHKAFHALTCAYMSGLLIHGSLHASAMGCIMQYPKLQALKREFGLKALVPVLKGKRGLFVNKKALHAADALLDKRWRERLNAYRAGGDGSGKIGGYSLKEVSLIERTFNSYDLKNDPDGFLGLHAVFKLLCVIHKRKNETVSRWA